MSVNRDSLLQAALTLLDAGPYDGLTIDALASTLRMSKSTLYKYFEGKDELIHALIEHLCLATETDLASNVESHLPAEVALKAMIGVYGRHAERVPRALVQQPERLPAHCRLRLENAERRLGSVCQTVVERGFASGAFKAENPSVAAYSVRAGLEGAMRFVRTEPAANRPALLDSLAPMYLDGLRAKA